MMAKLARPLIDHEFGGHHTDLKLSVVESYLRSYTKALRRIFKELWYIDAFAGTGSRSIKHKAVSKGLFGEEAAPARVEQRRGSAQIAIDVKPQFDFLVFIEKKKSFVKALEQLKADNAGRNISVVPGDANEAILNLLKNNSWSSKRAVLFLDPYGMQVHWETLKSVAKTEAIDVWYLFPLSGFYRQLPRFYSKLDASKRESLNRMFGSQDWEKDIYPIRRMRTLSGEMQESRIRTKNVRDLENYAKTRLEEIFGAVLEPLRLPRKKGPQRYSLFLCISSRNRKAIEVATRIGNHILKTPGISS